MWKNTNVEQERYRWAAAMLDDAKLAANFARALKTLDAERQPAGQILCAGKSFLRARRVGLLAGSFNPLTRAHVALARAARAAGRLDAILWTLSVVTVDKERVDRASLVDRLLQLSAFVDGGRDALALINRGLYVELASVTRSLMPQLEELVIVIGFDKIVQILDPRYYDDRDVVLDRLFASASLLVAPRVDETEENLNALLSREENRRYQGCVSFCPLPRRFRGDSSSKAREIARVSASDRQLRALLPPEGRALVEETRAYLKSWSGDGERSQIDTYTTRQELILWLAGLDLDRAIDGVRLNDLITAWLESSLPASEVGGLLVRARQIAGERDDKASRGDVDNRDD